jgi:hypothetical protein
VTTRAALPLPTERTMQVELRLRLPPSPHVGDNGAGVRPGRAAAASPLEAAADVGVWLPASHGATGDIPVSDSSVGSRSAERTHRHNRSGDKSVAETGGC